MRAHLLAACTLTLLCVRAHADSAPVWLQVTTPHFTVVTDANEKQARNIAAQFERMQAVFSTILPAAHSGPDAQIVVLALRNKRDFQAIEPAEYLAKDKLDLSGLFIQSDERCYILVRLDANGDHPYSTIYHEYTHYITRHAHLPLWLNEGIAEFYENTDIESHETHFGQPDLIDLNLLRSQSLLPLAMLFTVDRASPYYHEQHKGTIFYAESWALTYMLYMNDLRNKTSLISDYLSALSAGQDSLTAAVTAFGDLGKLEGTLSSRNQPRRARLCHSAHQDPHRRVLLQNHSTGLRRRGCLSRCRPPFRRPHRRCPQTARLRPRRQPQQCSRS